VERAFKKKNDFYYITLLVYVAFLAVYIFVTGTITDETVQFGFRDPVVYIIAIFILHALTMLIVNVVRNQRLIITDDAFVFTSRFKERRIPFVDIEGMVLTRDRRKPIDGNSAVLKLRIPKRRRVLRIRMANYEHEKELYAILNELVRKRTTAR